MDVLFTANHTFGKFYMAGAPFYVAPNSTVSSQILHHDAFYPLQILLETMGLLCRPQGTCRNPTLAKCGGEAQHLEKVRIWSPPGFPNV